MMRKRFMVMAIDWALVSMVYYGIGMSTTVLGGNIFLNFIGASLAEIVGYIICILITDFWGRKPVMIFRYKDNKIQCIITRWSKSYFV